MFQGSETSFLYYLDEGLLQMLARGRFAATAILRAKGEPTLLRGDRRSGVFVFARAGGWDGHMALLRVVGAFVAFASSATAGAAGGRGATALSSMTGSGVLLAAVMGAGGRGSFFMARAAGGCFPSSRMPTASSVMMFFKGFGIRFFLWSWAGEG